VSCRPELVTGYVDGALDATPAAEIEAHLATCQRCREQAEFERRARSLWQALPQREPNAGFEDKLRRRLRAERPARWRWALPLAAGLAALVFWGRSAAPFVALELSLDHAKCFSRGTLPAKVWADDPERVNRWFSERGTPLPPVPASAGGLSLVGGRYCPLLDRQAAHLYYTSDGRHVSLYVLPGSLHGERGFARRVAGRHVRLLSVAGEHVGIVAEHREDVAAFEHSLVTTLALRQE
jgi:anti-sigma factor RsiW